VKVPWKWVLSVAGVAILVLTGFLAHWSFAAKDDACVRAGRGLDAARDATIGIVRDFVLDAGRKLGDAHPERPGEIPPPPFMTIGRESGLGQVTDIETIRVVDGDAELWFRIGARQVQIWRKVGDEQFVYGMIPLDALLARLAADARIGEPQSRRWTRLQLVDGDGDVVLERSDVAPAKRKRQQPGLVPYAQQSIREGKASEPIGSEHWRPYKDAADKLAWGSWAPVFEGEKAPRLWALVEVRNADVVAGVGGIRIEAFDREFELLLWHVTLGLGLLLCIASAFFWLPGRGGAEVSVLLRTYQFAKPYAWGIGVAVVVGAIYGGSRAARAMLAKFLVDNVFVSQGSDEDKWKAIWLTVGLTLAIGLVSAVCNYFKEYLQNFYSTAMMADVRIAVARKIVSLPLSFFNRSRSGELLARIERDVTGMRAVLLQVFDKAFVAPFLLVGSIVIAFYMNWQLALVLFGLPLLLIPVFRIAKKVKKRATKRQDIVADISHVLFQMLSGIKVVKAFHGEEREAKRLDAANRRYIHEARRIARLMAFSESLLDFLQMVGGAIVVYLGGRGVMSGTVQMSDLVGFIVVIISIYDAAKDITSVLNKMTDALPAVARVYEILDTENEMKDGPRVAPPGPLTRGIELRGVSFRYVDNDILKDADLLIPAGKVVAIVGPTGAGKTTLCDLVARFYDPTQGSVLWDGVDAREYTTTSLAAKLAIVTQEAFLFNAPIDENIRYGRENATDAEVVAAAQDANVHDEIVKMEGGYGKTAGERGASLSGGQRQRVTIARAIIKDAPVLILDEATSNLDTTSEKRVQAALSKLMQHRTVIVVAHRLSTIRNADKVVVVDGGRIVEEGAPDDLLKRPGGRFRQMYELQTGERPMDDDGGVAAAV
jgi:subfamily B ATP-binding cassette protein MsbA